MSLPIAQVRFARPTDRLPEVEQFYAEHLGLPVIYRFTNHAGYDGVMLGLPGADQHLKFTSHADGSLCPTTALDNLLVLYPHSEDQMYDVVERLGAHGHEPVDPENPGWTEVGALTFEDPDRWRVVLVPRPVF